MVITASAAYYINLPKGRVNIVLMTQKGFGIVEKIVASNLLCRENICNIAVLIYLRFSRIRLV